MTLASAEVRAFLAEAGRKGGRSKSARKQAASRQNGKLSDVSRKPASEQPRPAVLIITPQQEGK